MKVAYDISEHRSAKGEVVLDFEDEQAVKEALTEHERRAVIRGAALAHAQRENDWVDGFQVDFGIVPEEED